MLHVHSQAFYHHLLEHLLQSNLELDIQQWPDGKANEDMVGYQFGLLWTQHLEIISQCCVAQNDSLKSDETRKDDLVRTLDFLHGHFVTNVGFSPFFLFKVLRKLKSLPLKLHIFNSFFFHGPNCCFVLSFWGFTVALNLNVIKVHIFKVGFLKYFVSIKAILSLAASSSSL